MSSREFPVFLTHGALQEYFDKIITFCKSDLKSKMSQIW